VNQNTSNVTALPTTTSGEMTQQHQQKNPGLGTGTKVAIGVGGGLFVGANTIFNVWGWWDGRQTRKSVDVIGGLNQAIDARTREFEVIMKTMPHLCSKEAMNIAEISKSLDKAIAATQGGPLEESVRTHADKIKEIRSDNDKATEAMMAVLAQLTAKVDELDKKASGK